MRCSAAILQLVNTVDGLTRPDGWSGDLSNILRNSRQATVQQRATKADGQPAARLVFAALAPFSLGYFFSYLYRAVNAVVAPDLVRDLGLTASELGLLTSAYLLAFAVFQLPLGLLLDRFGPRRVQAALVALGGVGALLFAGAWDVLTLSLARALIGVGFAGGLMSSFKAVVLWVPAPRRALANACVMSLGAVGVIASSAPTEWAVGLLGWRQVFVCLGVATLVIALAILVVVPERRSVAQSGGLREQIADVGRIFRDRVFQGLVPLLAIPAGAHIALQTLWVGTWLRDVAGFTRVETGRALFVLGLAFLAGILLSGIIADRLTRRGISLLAVNLGFVLLFFVSQVAIIMPIPLPPVVVWAVFAMTGQSAVLAYPWLSSYFGTALSGRANTAANLLLFGSAFLIQYAVGAIIDTYPRTAVGGYAPDAYRAAFGIVLGLECLALLWFLANSRRFAIAEGGMAKPSDGPPHGRTWQTGPAT